jgi:ATP-dependent helicase HrpB
MLKIPPIDSIRYPVETLLADVQTGLANQRAVVLTAAPGAGKSTRLPLHLLQADWLHGQKIIMLEPRRLATRAIASRLAEQLGQSVGQTVGYRIHLETRVSRQTRLEVVTEGVLTRMLQSDPGLSGVGLVIFDEFHERSLEADLGLALCYEIRQAFNENLRILVMSATLDGSLLTRLLDDAPLLVSEGRLFPVETRYLAEPIKGARLKEVGRTIRQALRQEEGSILVFLPGSGEIRRCEEELRASGLPERVILALLFGNLSQDAQDQALLPAPPGWRKVVLATSIAETSLTIEGIRIVIDSGEMRRPSFAWDSGMTRLVTMPVSKFSAEQRRGRAGRLGPGICYRLWTATEQEQLREQTAPEICAADLARLVLELAEWGVTDPGSLRFPTPPPPAAFEQGRRLLQSLQALDAAGMITAHGRKLLQLPLHPRLAHMIARAGEWGRAGLACEIAALLSERDILRSVGPEHPADLAVRLRILAEPNYLPPGYHGPAALRSDIARIRQTAGQWQRQLGCADSDTTPQRPDSMARGDQHWHCDDIGRLLALAYPDRIAQRRPGPEPRYLLASGQGAFLAGVDPLCDAAYLVVASLDGQKREARIFLAAVIEWDEICRDFPGLITVQEQLGWDQARQQVIAERQSCLGRLILTTTPMRDITPEQRAVGMLDGIRQNGLGVLPWDDACRHWQARLAFLHRLDPAHWPDCSDDVLINDLEDWLLSHLTGINRLDQLKKLDLATILANRLDWKQRGELDRLAPARLTVPSGASLRIDYASGYPPILAVQIQKMFGSAESPTIAGGRVRLRLHLLSPAQRPMQVTDDLAGFWASSYHLVKKELRGRYPKHYWPDDPLEAEPTNRAKSHRPG